jgi:hypothetical protein
MPVVAPVINITLPEIVISDCFRINHGYGQTLRETIVTNTLATKA